MKQTFSELIEDFKKDPSEQNVFNMLNYFKKESLAIYAPIVLLPSDEDFVSLVGVRRGENYTMLHDMDFSVDILTISGNDNDKALYCFTNPDSIPDDFIGAPLQRLYLDEFISIVHTDNELAALPIVIDPKLPGEIMCGKELNEFILKTKQQETQAQLSCHPARNETLESVIKDELKNFTDIIAAYIAEVDQYRSNHFVVFLETIDNIENELAVQACLNSLKKITAPLALTISFTDDTALQGIKEDRRPICFYKKNVS